MVDPFSALGAAAAIVQLVDFGCKLLMEGYGSYKSVTGLSEESSEMQDVTHDLSVLSSKVAAFANSHSTSPSPEDVALAQIARKCHLVAEELNELIENLKVKTEGALRSWDAIRKSLKKFGNKEKIERLQKQLEKLQLNVNTCLLQAIQSQQSTISKTIQRYVERSDNLQIRTETLLTDLRNDLLGYLTALERDRRALRIGKKVVHVHGVSRLESSVTSTQGVIDTLHTMQIAGNVARARIEFLESLVYPEMPTRRHDINDAYSETFEWIFERDSTPFKTWLETGGGIFWISGKAGSGKSTLMKFLESHAQTRETLELWAKSDGKELHTCSFFFWSAGYPMQKSQEGLLRSLLLQILRRLPHLIPHIFPTRWYEYSETVFLRIVWTRRELVDGLHAILSADETHSSTRFCFFIDGLDEYEGNPTELIRDLSRIAQSRMVKLCVSSRPWTEFKDAYSSDKSRVIVLQNLTRPDMDRFTRGMLENDEIFVDLAKSDPEAQDVITEILDKAHGVFLWVFLVVRSLLRGLGKHDDVSVLKERLRELPPDLDDYFMVMINRIEPVYREKAAKLMQLSVHSNGPLPVMATIYLSQQKPEFEPALSNPIKLLEQKDAEALVKTATDILNAWCGDLLEVHVLDEPFLPSYLYHRKIEFLHRTVRDFMLTKQMQDWLDSHIKTTFETELTLLRIQVFRAKILDRHDKSIERVEAFRHHVVEEAMRCAMGCEEFPEEIVRDLINEVDRVGNYIWPPKSDENGFHWTFAGEHVKGNFLALAVWYGLVRYVRASLDQTPRSLFSKSTDPFLDFALKPVSKVLLIGPSWQIKKEMVQLLLDRGADPNEVFLVLGKETTPWQSFLGLCVNLKDFGGLDHRDLEIAKLMISKGARCDIKPKLAFADIIVDKEKSKTVTDCLCYCFDLSAEEAKAIISTVNTKPVRRNSRWFSRLLVFSRSRSHDD